jgi:hypothetical protein
VQDCWTNIDRFYFGSDFVVEGQAENVEVAVGVVAVVRSLLDQEEGVIRYAVWGCVVVMLALVVDVVIWQAVVHLHLADESSTDHARNPFPVAEILVLVCFAKPDVACFVNVDEPCLLSEEVAMNHYSLLDEVWTAFPFHIAFLFLAQAPVHVPAL